MESHREREKAAKKAVRTKKKENVSKGVKVAKGVRLKPGQAYHMKKKKGSSSTGKYKNVSPKSFVGAAGGASKYSFPVPDLAHARNALARAHFAPNPAGIKAAVYRKYPQLKKRHEERAEGHKPKPVGGSKRSKRKLK